jgi:hypothetical protein
MRMSYVKFCVTCYVVVCWLRMCECWWKIGCDVDRTDKQSVHPGRTCTTQPDTCIREYLAYTRDTTDKDTSVSSPDLRRATGSNTGAHNGPYRAAAAATALTAAGYLCGTRAAQARGRQRITQQGV